MVAFMEESSIEAWKGYCCGHNGFWAYLAAQALSHITNSPVVNSAIL
jgi:hypothetical protein